MSRPRFLADHDFNEHIILGVQRREPASEFLRARDVGLSRRPDTDILEFACEEGLLVVSHDVNTMPGFAESRLSAGEPLMGLFMVQQKTPVGTVVDDLILIWAASEQEDWRGKIIFLPLD